MNSVLPKRSPGLYWYEMKTESADVMVLDGKGNPKQKNSPGS